MPAPCQVCVHADREAIDAALIGGRESGAAIAARHRISDDAVNRHRKHIPPLMAKSKEAAETLRGGKLFEQLVNLEERAHRLLDQAEASGDYKASFTGIRELRGIVELMAKLLGELQPEGSTVINIFNSPQFVRVQAVILETLEPFPEARQALADRLEKIDVI